MTTFPTSVDTFANAATINGKNLDNIDGAGKAHHVWMGDVGDAIEAIETKIILTDPQEYSGSGAPEGVQTAVVGSRYTRTSNGAFYIKTSGSGNTGWTQLSAGTSHNTSLSPYGNGVDGALTYDGSTTILGMAPSTNVYTLTRDIYATTIVVNNGVTINVNGYTIYAKTSVTTNGTGAITAGGTPASGATGGVTAGSVPGRGTIFQGGNGATATTTTSSATGAINPSLGGKGGAGGSGASGAGGTTGNVTSPVGNQKGGFNNQLPLAFLGWTYQLGSTGTVTLTAIGGGTGGGGGGGDSTNTGGGGGFGGGILIINALAIANNGTISANGGNGAAATVGNCGGGGGGGGGTVVLNCESRTGNAATATGGTGGAKVGTGVAGTAGNAGTVTENIWS